MNINKICFLFLCGTWITIPCFCQEEYSIGLSSGIRKIAILGDSEKKMQQRSKLQPKVISIDDAGLEKLKIEKGYFFSDAGVKAYFRNNVIVMILLQEPFQGSIQGKNLSLFHSQLPPKKTWEEALTRELGEPTARGTGGKLGSEVLFYSWGDISYNRMGPNQLALYRDTGIAQYRLRNFGKDLQLFQEKR